MPPSRRLRLAREALGELATDELRAVAGGTHLGCEVTDDCTHGCTVVGSIRPACLTVDPVECLHFTQFLTCGCPPTDNC